ncbi:RHS repeat-associated core domain-containing protein [Aquimarina sp. 2304DJ70-9]|uniref:RHS repeat-associated core domain-containing protein n=1 Tax=Aquimarina penaris TaxID=3231044 RepID=UPI00346248A9
MTQIIKKYKFQLLLSFLLLISNLVNAQCLLPSYTSVYVPSIAKSYSKNFVIAKIYQPGCSETILFQDVPSWITSITGNDAGQLNFTVAANATDIPREAVITAVRKNTNGGQGTKVLRIIQEAPNRCAMPFITDTTISGLGGKYKLNAEISSKIGQVGCTNEYEVENLPSWISNVKLDISGLQLTVLPNYTGADREIRLTIRRLSTGEYFSDGLLFYTVIQKKMASFDNDNHNWVATDNFAPNGTKIASSIHYYDDLGRTTQTQTIDMKTKDTWASQTLYDNQGRSALQTLSAPTNKEISTDFFYRYDFVRNSDGTIFNTSDFERKPEDPSLIGTQENTLGWYYSTKNSNEPYQDVTARPYTRTIYSTLNPGIVLKTIGGNKINDEWKNGYSFSMPAGQELSSVAAFGDAKYTNYKVIKTVSRDVHGVENVVFTNTDGHTLAAARSGNEEGNTINRTSQIRMGRQGFVDIHIPKGTQGITIDKGIAKVTLDIYNLITEQKVTTVAGSLPPGFYRVAVRDLSFYYPSDVILITYPENYYDYSLNYYDKTGRLLSSKQPLNKLESTFDYNSLGQLETTTSPDEGEAKFKYRKDGQIRFSQNSKQALAGEFSYTNYDDLGRPIESGVIESTDFATADPDAALPLGTTKERHITQYDFHDNYELATAFGSDARKSNYAAQSFVSGNVAKTYTTNPETTTTWYSYDIYGRVQWIVQQINGLTGVKTIDYVYDPITSQVTKVYYQKGNTVEQFIHKYTYDSVDYSLVKVETSTDDVVFTEHASYEYYETGALKRINIAQGLQGLDYVYNLQGALKSINHPSLASTNDPGGDANDLFGMMIDYHNYDYNRPLRNIKSAEYGTNQYNGNIKGIRWSSDYNPIPDKEHTYSYLYNRKNWLQGATYGNFTGDYTSIPKISEGGGGGNAEQDYIISTDVVNSGGTQNYKANRSITMKPGFHAKEGSDFSGKIDGGNPAVHDINAGSLANNPNGDYKVGNITYDANGNIQSLDRNKHTENGSNAMDQLSYTYKTDKPNQLLRVDDAAGDVAGADDIGDQNGDNYEYNSIGQLVKNNAENITYIYNASGLVTEVHKDNIPLVKFFYNDKGHRVRKESYNPTTSSLTYTEHYVRDAAGTAMAIYRDGQVIENTIYGASRLGVRKPDGTHLYQLTDHLGNVRAVIGRSPSGQAMAMTTATDYYPFGMPMPNRTLSGAEGYRYTYQGQEKDPGTGKEAFELRLWDARIGRWLTTDPAGQYNSPYLGMGNNPITMVDPDGGAACPNPPCNGGDLPPGSHTLLGEDGFVNDEFNFTNGIQDLGEIVLNGQSLNNNSLKEGLQRAFYRGYGFAKLWEQFGYIEIGFNTMQGAPLEVKLTKAYAIEIATDKEIPFSATYTNRDGGKITRGVENHDKEFTIGLGAAGGGSVSIIDNPDGNVQVGAAAAYQVMTSEYLYSIDADEHGNHHSTFLGLDITPGFGVWYGIEGTLRVGLLIEN